MATVTGVITGSSDSGTELSASGDSVILNGDPLQCRASSGDHRTPAIRFDLSSGALAQGDTINSAHLVLEMSPASRDDIRCDIVAEDVDSPAVLTTTAGSITSRIDSSATTASVEWQNTGTGAGSYNSADITDVIQEIVDRAGWDEQYIMIFLDPRSYTSGEFCFFAGNGNADEITLEIDYTAGGAAADDFDGAEVLTPGAESYLKLYG
jgi:hypothetical protein